MTEYAAAADLYSEAQQLLEAAAGLTHRAHPLAIACELDRMRSRRKARIPPLSRTNGTRRAPCPALIGHAAPRSPY
jgi:hypothetical protein